MSINIQGVSKSFGTIRALDNVNITFEEGIVYGLLGNNGAGKTTLLSLIANRIFPDAGSISVDGQPVADNDEVLGRMILMGAQNLYTDETRVHHAVEYAELLYPHFNKDYAMDLLERFNVNLKAKVKSLSTGYGTILRDIIALSAGTPYLLLDEPVLGLDAQHRDMLYKQLIALCAEAPRTVVISTHLIAEVAPLIEHTIILDEGRVLADAPTDQLLDHVRNVTGPRNAVNSFTSQCNVLSETTIGGLKTACIQLGDKTPSPNAPAAAEASSASPASADAFPAPPAGVEISPVDLQSYFIALMEQQHGTQRELCTPAQDDQPCTAQNEQQSTEAPR